MHNLSMGSLYLYCVVISLQLIGNYTLQIMDGEVITAKRTAAASAVATKVR